METKKRDLVLILIWPTLAALISFLIKANVFISILLFFGIPAFYLSFLNKKFIKKIALFSVIITIPLGIIMDYIMELTGGWFLPYSVFGSFRLFNYVTLEQLIWLFLYIYFVVMFYETFIEKECKIKTYYPTIKYLVIGALFIIGIFVTFYFLNPSLLYINYFYLKIGIVLGLLPIILILFRFPRLYAKFLKTGAYFFFLSFIYEVTALQLDQWVFPKENQFIGWVNIVGLGFPFEELFFWIILGAIAVLSYYEFFDDDRN